MPPTIPILEFGDEAGGVASGVAKSAGVTAELRLGDLGGGHFRHSINTVYPFAFAAMSTVGIGLFDRAVS